MDHATRRHHRWTLLLLCVGFALVTLPRFSSAECPYGHGGGGGMYDDYQDHHQHEQHDHHHHGHSHEADERPASFKYSRQANEEVLASQAHTHEAKADPFHSNTPKQPPPPVSNKKSVSDIWLHAIGSTVLISIVPFLILFVIPLDNSAEKQPFLKILLSFASGGLLGDAFLHLIPHALLAQQAAEAGSHGHGHSHGGHGHSHGSGGEEHTPHDMSVGLWVLAGIIAFLMVEKLVRIVKGGHGHSHGTPVAKVAEKPAKKPKKAKASDDENEDKSADEKEDDHNDEAVEGNFSFITANIY